MNVCLSLIFHAELSYLFQIFSSKVFSASDSKNKLIQRQVGECIEFTSQYTVHALLNGLDLLGELTKVVLNSFLNLRVRKTIFNKFILQ